MSPKGKSPSKKKAKKAVTRAKKKRPNKKPSGCLRCKLKKLLLECGESGQYGGLKRKSGKGKFDRDHVPAKGALKEFARNKIAGGEALCPEQEKAIDAIGNAIAIPKAAHGKYSRSSRGYTKKKIREDAKNLQKAARLDTAAMKKGFKKKRLGASDKCIKLYNEWAKHVTSLTNADYKKMLKEATGK